ncbi:hypothetical protein DY000_02007099 [Brassica cretica]|uniref:Uncharacterized protein n=1 Tax=Brassica cretica TaxID=69181 RepID=A0ABQ7BUA0_BRACR|nr:hypothetical protein DY000_02007099 [Brassica cretica]
MESVSEAFQNAEGPNVEDEFDEEAVERDAFEIEQLVDNMALKDLGMSVFRVYEHM